MVVNLAQKPRELFQGILLLASEVDQGSLATDAYTLLLQSDLDLALRLSGPSVSADDAASFASDIETYARY